MNEDVELQYAQVVAEAFEKLSDGLKTPCRVCKMGVKDCPVAQLKSDREITLCQAKRAFNFVRWTLEFLSGREVKFGKKIKRRSNNA